MYKKGGFPDLTGDGKITQADILKGRGVFKSGGMKDPNPGITALRKEAPEVVAKMGYQKGGSKKRIGNLNPMTSEQINKAFKNVGGQNYSGNFDAGSPPVDFNVPPTAMDTVRAYHHTNVPAMSLLNNVDADAYKKLQIAQNKLVYDEYQTGGLLNSRQQAEIAKQNEIYRQQQVLTPKSKYQAGGMYGSNEIPAGIGSTAMTVYQETDPRVQEEQAERMEDTAKNLSAEGDTLAREMEQDKAQDEAAIQAASDQAGAKADSYLSGAQKLAGMAEQAGVVGGAGEETAKAGQDVAGLGSAGVDTGMVIGKYSKDGKLLLGNQAQSLGGQGTSLGGAIKDAAQAFKAQKATNAAIKSGQLMASSAGTAGKAGLATLGRGLGSFAKSGAGIGTIASLAGAGVSKLADDNDPTKMNFGEGAGATLSGIGTGIGAAATTAMLAGSTLGPVGTLVGAGLGAAYGLGKGLVQRNKAKKEKLAREDERRDKITAFNKNLQEDYAKEKATMRGMQLKSKTYSGYDLGRNLVAKTGGMKLGIPRY